MEMRTTMSRYMLIKLVILTLINKKPTRKEYTKLKTTLKTTSNKSISSSLNNMKVPTGMMIMMTMKITIMNNTDCTT